MGMLRNVVEEYLSLLYISQLRHTTMMRSCATAKPPKMKRYPPKKISEYDPQQKNMFPYIAR